MGRASRGLLLGLRRLSKEDDSLSDRELLARFAAGRDEGSFAALVRRHRPMVFATCCRALPCEQDAEDVFQAVFLVLARKAGGRWRDGAWHRRRPLQNRFDRRLGRRVGGRGLRGSGDRGEVRRVPGLLGSGGEERRVSAPLKQLHPDFFTCSRPPFR
jgi:hypothetical protein